MILRQSLSAAFVACFLLFAQAQVHAQPYQAGHIKVEDLWIRATPPGQPKINGAGYLKITNHGNDPDKLLSVKADISEKTAIHETRTTHGVAKMHEVNAITIPGNSTVSLSPANYHIMFITLKKPLKQGDVVPATLTFEKAGDVSVKFNVKQVTHRPVTPHAHPANSAH